MYGKTGILSFPVGVQRSDVLLTNRAITYVCILWGSSCTPLTRNHSQIKLRQSNPLSIFAPLQEKIENGNLV